ncbi:hypothetical protein ABTG11_19350 [Acinetobacter baumannii]
MSEGSSAVGCAVVDDDEDDDRGRSGGRGRGRSQNGRASCRERVWCGGCRARWTPDP